MCRSTGHLLAAICLSLSVAVISIVSPVTSYGQDKETVLISLGPLKSEKDCNLFPNYEWYTYQYTIPDGKRLTIEQIFFEVTSPTTGVKARGRVKITTYSDGSINGSSQLLPVQFVNLSNSSDTILSTSQQMKVYIPNLAGDGKTVKVSFIVYPQTYGNCFYNEGTMGFSGYLETLP